MGNSFYFIFEPEVIIFLQRILGEAGKYIATFLTYLGEDFLLVGILIFMYWCIDKRYARNIALLVIAGTAAGPMIAFLLTGSFVVETIFTIPGIGREFVTAVSNRDYTVVMGLTIFIGALIILCNLIADLLCALIDPRIKLTE